MIAGIIEKHAVLSPLELHEGANAFTITDSDLEHHLKCSTFFSPLWGGECEREYAATIWGNFGGDQSPTKQSRLFWIVGVYQSIETWMNLFWASPKSVIAGWGRDAKMSGSHWDHLILFLQIRFPASQPVFLPHFPGHQIKMERLQRIFYIELGTSSRLDRGKWRWISMG